MENEPDINKLKKRVTALEKETKEIKARNRTWQRCCRMVLEAVKALPPPASYQPKRKSK
jgi:hypothetical protein